MSPVHPSRIRRVVARAAASVAVALTAACSDGSGPAPIPAAIAAMSATVAAAEVGSALPTAPSFVVRDGSGRALGGVAVRIAVGEGGGTLRNAPTRTANGATSVGQWTLGTRSGRNTLVVTVDKLPPFTIEATALPGPAAEIRVASGNNQVALAGDEVVEPIAALVVDRFGNPVPQQTVRFDALLGGGTVNPATAVTDANGIAGGVRWTLGRALSSQTARASVLPLTTEFAARTQSDFTIDVRFVGTPSPQAADAFRVAAERIRTAIIGDLPDVSVTALDVSRCGAGAGATLTEVIDDIVIFASVSPIDGPGRVLGRAGPCYLRSASQLSLVGQMQFDDADANTLLTSDRFESVVLHEMLHVIGIGSLWRLRGLIDGAGTADPRFNGAIAFDRCGVIGFGGECAGGVPLENTGGSGTAEVHWRESIFDRELMTGFAESTSDMPFSVMTLGALADYGYVVNEKAADPFRSLAARLAPRLTLGGRDTWDEVLVPAFEVTPFGMAQPIRPLATPARSRN